MTEHTKPPRLKWGDQGSKCARRTKATIWDAGKHRPIILTLYPNGLIGLRLERRRREEIICADVAYKQAVVDRIASERRAKRKLKGKIS